MMSDTKGIGPNRPFMHQLQPELRSGTIAGWCGSAWSPYSNPHLPRCPNSGKISVGPPEGVGQVSSVINIAS